MSEIKRVGHPLESITPDRGRRVARARELTQAIGEMQQRQTPGTNVTSVDPTKTAENLGIYDRLGVTTEEVKGEMKTTVEAPKLQGASEITPQPAKK